jgi:hypothetical protein
MTLVLPVPWHLPDARERRLQKRLVDHQHAVKVQRSFALWRIAKRWP